MDQRSLPTIAFDDALINETAQRSPYPSQVRAILKRGFNNLDSYIEEAAGLRAASYNARVKAGKWLMREGLKDVALSDKERAMISFRLSQIKLRKMDRSPPSDRVPEPEEVRLLIGEADRTLALMLRFLWQTGCRVSEMLSLRVVACRRGRSITHAVVRAKGGNEVDLRLKTALYDDIRNEFNGTEFLFEHHHRPYSRVSVSQRIKELSYRMLGKPFTAHSIRHAVGALATKELGIEAAQALLHHRDIRTTMQTYAHYRLTDRDLMGLTNMDEL